MCGIVGYVGKKSVVPVIIEGLRKLEYRGYDSAGIAVAGKSALLEVCRAEGKLRNLEEALKKKPLEGTFGIGHTRWATHGRPTEENAPSAPRLHWENRGGAQWHCRELPVAEEEADREGHKFSTETDTEVIAHLVEKHLGAGGNGTKISLEDAVRKTVKMLTGVFALGVISVNDPDKIVAARNGPQRWSESVTTNTSSHLTCLACWNTRAT